MKMPFQLLASAAFLAAGCCDAAAEPSPPAAPTSLRITFTDGEPKHPTCSFSTIHDISSLSPFGTENRSTIPSIKVKGEFPEGWRAPLPQPLDIGCRVSGKLDWDPLKQALSVDLTADAKTLTGYDSFPVVGSAVVETARIRIEKFNCNVLIKPGDAPTPCAGSPRYLLQVEADPRSAGGAQ